MDEIVNGALVRIKLLSASAIEQFSCVQAGAICGGPTAPGIALAPAFDHTTTPRATPCVSGAIIPDGPQARL
jgi:hypothetical protein